jgi:hypothetical protein
VAAADLPPADAAASIDAIRRTIATDARWRGVGRGAAAPIQAVPVR